MSWLKKSTDPLPTPAWRWLYVNLPGDVRPVRVRLDDRNTFQAKTVTPTRWGFLVPSTQRAFNLHIEGAPGYTDLHQVVSVPFAVAGDLLPKPWPNPLTATQAAYGPVVRAMRPGAIRLQGKGLTDDLGRARLLGLTFMWGVYGFRHERAHFDQELAWLAAQPNKPDYLWILGQVEWPNRAIDPNWPDYAEALAGTIDAFYAAGFKTFITVIGGGAADPIDAARKVAAVTCTRADKVVGLECWNEYYATRGDLGVIKQMAGVLLASSGIAAVGLSSGSGEDDDLARASDEAGATLDLAHTARDAREAWWEGVRQAYDFAKSPRLAANAEPPGPHSSVAELRDPLRLATMLALSWQNGAAFGVLHVGDMVLGVDNDQYHPERVSHLADVDGLPAMLAACVRARDFLPLGTEDWHHTLGTLNAGVHILNPDHAAWDGPGGTGCNRSYGAYNDAGDFAQVVLGIRGGVMMFLVFPGATSATFEALNPVTGERLSFSGAGPFVLPGEDSEAANAAWLLRGRIG